MDKIVVIGSPGAGKTTFARRLGDLLKIKVIHLDRHFWEPRWKEKPREVRESIQHDLVHRDRWIIEGTYLDSSDERLNAADTIIFLDIPWLLCLWRVVRRRIVNGKAPRPDLAEGCPEKLRVLYLLKVLVFPQRGRRLFLMKKREIEERQLHWEKEKKTAFYWLKSNKDIETFLLEDAVLRRVQPASAADRQKRAVFPRVAAVTAISLGYLGFGLGAMNSSLPFAILHPVVLLKHLIQRRHSNKMR
jgi:adenylate kinase family enzyme